MASRRGQQRLRNPTRPPLSPTPLHIHRGLLQSPGLPGCPFKLRVTHSIPNRACSQNQTGRAERPSHKNPQPEQMQRCAQAHSEGLHVVQSLSGVRLFATPWTAARQASLSITSSLSLLKLMSIESVMPSNHLILCRSLPLPPSIFPSTRVFSNELVLHIRWPKYWTFSFRSVLPMNIQD